MACGFTGQSLPRQSYYINLLYMTVYWPTLQNEAKRTVKGSKGNQKHGWRGVCVFFAKIVLTGLRKCLVAQPVEV